jgi:hypothetical protein
MARWRWEYLQQRRHDVRSVAGTWRTVVSVWKRQQKKGVVKHREQWDDFTCPSCGKFEYRHRTRKLRRVQQARADHSRLLAPDQMSRNLLVYYGSRKGCAGSYAGLFAPV